MCAASNFPSVFLVFQGNLSKTKKKLHFFWFSTEKPKKLNEKPKKTKNPKLFSAKTKKTEGKTKKNKKNNSPDRMVGAWPLVGSDGHSGLR